MIYSMTGLWCFMIAHGSAFQVTFYDRVVYAPGHEHSGWPRCWPLGPSSPRRIPDASLVKHSMKQSGPICFERLIIGQGRACPRSWLEPSQLCKSRRVCSMPKSDGYRSVIERYRMWPSAAPCTIGFCRRFFWSSGLFLWYFTLAVELDINLAVCIGAFWFYSYGPTVNMFPVAWATIFSLAVHFHFFVITEEAICLWLPS